MIVNVINHRGYTLVIPKGHLGAATAPQLRATLAGLLARRWPLIIDLGQVTFLSAEGFGVLMGTARRARATDVSVHLICPDRHTRRLFQLTGLARRLAITRTRDEAVAGLSSRPPDRSRQPPRAGRHPHPGSWIRAGHGLAAGQAIRQRVTARAGRRAVHRPDATPAREAHAPATLRACATRAQTWPLLVIKSLPRPPVSPAPLVPTGFQGMRRDGITFTTHGSRWI